MHYERKEEHGIIAHTFGHNTYSQDVKQRGLPRHRPDAVHNTRQCKLTWLVFGDDPAARSLGSGQIIFSGRVVRAC